MCEVREYCRNVLCVRYYETRKVVKMESFWAGYLRIVRNYFCRSAVIYIADGVFQRFFSFTCVSVARSVLLYLKVCTRVENSLVPFQRVEVYCTPVSSSQCGESRMRDKSSLGAWRGGIWWALRTETLPRLLWYSRCPSRIVISHVYPTGVASLPWVYEELSCSYGLPLLRYCHSFALWASLLFWISSVHVMKLRVPVNCRRYCSLEVSWCLGE